MAENKTKATEASVEDYINSLPTERKREDGFTVLEMMKSITGLEPKMWGPSIIGFDRMTYKYESGHGGEMPKIAFSPRKQRLVLYVITNFEGQEEMLARLGKYKTGKVCLYINKLADVDISVLEEIIRTVWKQANTKPKRQLRDL